MGVPGPLQLPTPSCLQTWPTVTLKLVAICRSSNSLGIQGQKETPTQPKSKNIFTAASKLVKISPPSPGHLSQTAHSAYVSSSHHCGRQPWPHANLGQSCQCVLMRSYLGVMHQHSGKHDPGLIELCVLAHQTWAKRLGQNTPRTPSKSAHGINSNSFHPSLNLSSKATGFMDILDLLIFIHVFIHLYLFQYISIKYHLCFRSALGTPQWARHTGESSQATKRWIKPWFVRFAVFTCKHAHRG